MKKVLVTGAGGFIGHHLTKYLVDRGYRVRGVDIKEPEYESTAAHEFELLDLRKWDNCLMAARGIDEIYALAANMGGIGFIESNKAVIVRDSTLISMHTLEAARVQEMQAPALYVERVHLSGVSAKERECNASKGGRRLPGGCRRRLWMGEALYRARMPALSGRLRAGDADCAFS